MLEIKMQIQFEYVTSIYSKLYFKLDVLIHKLILKQYIAIKYNLQDNFKDLA